MQQTSTTSVLTNWVSITLRWLTLLVIALSLSFGSRFTLAVGIVLISAALWNVWLSVWLLLKQQRFAHKLVLIAVDMLTVYVLFAMSGTLGGGLGWTGILPIITASLMYGLLGAAAVIPINLVVQGLLSLLDGDLYTVGLFILTLLPIYLIAGAVFGFIGQRMLRIREQEARALVRTRLEAQRTERERSRVIYNLISTLSSSLNYQRVLETSLDLSASAMEKIDDRHDQLVSGVLLFVADESGGTYLQVGSARRFTQADLRLTLQGRQGAIGKAIDGGNPQLTRVISQDPELGMIVAMRVCQAVYIVPLRVGLDNYGVMVFGHPEEKYFTPERTEVLDIVGNQSVIAIQNARLY
ncbi:MAG: GAF domain-containing protein, partial [Anaerolineales bacterium]|nr:GAF domain-containing protein [Anaerolineales bacterium]